jgi:chorismate synthase
MEILGGPLFAVAGAGESHGPAITTIVFGCPPGLSLSRAAVQAYLDRRRPGSNKHGTPRHEADKVVFLSGLYSDDLAPLLAGPEIAVLGESSESYETGLTTGEPIAALVLSTAKKSGHYAQFSGPTGEVRPGHTDLVKHHQSQGFVDVRGGGRSSYRSTISDVIGGSIARIFLQATFGTVILSSIYQVGPLTAQRRLADYFGPEPVAADDLARLEADLLAAEIPSFDPDFAREAGELIKQTRIDGDSIGAALEVVAVNVPPLVGEPLYHSLKVRLMGALGGLHAAQFCEIGAGAEAVARRGSENNDPIRRSGYQTNHHGGLLGGITTGSPLVCRVGFKPTSTIVKPQLSCGKIWRRLIFNWTKGGTIPAWGCGPGDAGVAAGH